MNALAATTHDAQFYHQFDNVMAWIAVVASALAVVVFIWMVTIGGRLSYDEQVGFLEGYLEAKEGKADEQSGLTDTPDDRHQKPMDSR